MATWQDVVNLCTDLGAVATDSDNDTFRYGMQFDNGRKQSCIIMFQRATNGAEWVLIDSPIGDVDANNLPVLLDNARRNLCGGVIAYPGGSPVVLHHSQPLSSLRVEDLLSILGLILKAADDLQATFVGDDPF